MSRKARKFVADLINDLVGIGVDAALARTSGSPPPPEEATSLEGVERSIDQWEREADQKLKTMMGEIPPASEKTLIPTADYCLECLVKHFNACSGNLDEAIDFYKEDGKTTPRVVEKIRTCDKELSTLRDDLPSEAGVYPDIDRLGHEARMFRKKIWETKASIGIGDGKALNELKATADKLRDETYEVAKRQAYDLCDFFDEPAFCRSVLDDFTSGKIASEEVINRLKDKYGESGVEAIDRWLSRGRK